MHAAMRNRWWLICLVPLGLLTGLVCYQGSRRPASSPTPPLQRVSVQSVQACTPERLFEAYYGVLRPRRSAVISTKIAERVEELYFDVGDSVEQGSPLVQLNAAELQNSLRLASGELDAATARLDEVVAGARQQEIERAVASVSERKAAVELRKLTYQRMVSASKTDSVASQEVDQSSFMLRAAEAQLAVAEQTLDELRMGVRPEQIAAQRAAVEVARAKLRHLELQLEEATICAPFHGTIQEVYVTEGELLKPGQPILSILDIEQIEVHAGLPPSKVAAVANASQPANIAVSINGRDYIASLDRISPAIDDVTGMQKAIFTLKESKDVALVPGLAVTVQIQTDVDSSAIWVPRSCLVSSAHGQWSCYVARSTAESEVYQIEQQPIEIIREQADLIQVQGELHKECLIVVNGTHRISPGQKVLLRTQDAADSVNLVSSH